MMGFMDFAKDPFLSKKLDVLSSRGYNLMLRLDSDQNLTYDERAKMRTEMDEIHYQMRDAAFKHRHRKFLVETIVWFIVLFIACYMLIKIS